MPSEGPKRVRIVRKASGGRRHEPPPVEGRPLIEGSDRLTFPAFYREEVKPVTFRGEDALRSREEREEYVCAWFERVRKKEHLALVLIPHDIYSDGRHAFFKAGWTLEESDGEIRTRQCVVFLADDPVPIGRADQGVICVAWRDELSAWDGRTEEQSRLSAA